MVCLLYYAVLGFILWATHGMFNPTLVVVLTAATLAFLAFAPRKKEMDGKPVFLSTAIISAFLMLILVWPGLLYFSKEPPLGKIYNFLNLSTAIATLVFAAWWLRYTISKRETALPIVVFCILGYAYFLVMQAVPIPKIDVFIIDSLAVDHLTSGANPYLANYPDLYNGAYGYTPGFTYWPAYLIFAIPARMAGDIRLANFIALLFDAWGLYRLNRASGGSRTESQLTALLLTCFPVGLFVLEQAWIDTLLSAIAIAIALLLQGRRWLWAGVLAGLAIGTKQYGFLIALPTLAFILRRAGWKAALPSAFAAGMTAIALLMPFILWNWASFYKNTIDILIKIPNRPDSLSLPALYFYFFRSWPPGDLLLIIYLAVLAGSVSYLLFKPKVQLAHWAFSVAGVHAVIFLMGKQAFCNYYYLLAIFVLLLFSIRRQWNPDESAQPQ